MRFDPVGKAGQGPVEEGTSFGGLTVQTPEAWRFTNFFGRAVEAMNSVYRYELGAPVPLELQTLILTRRAMERCSFTSVRLDRSGRVLEASVRRTSGIAELDQIIIEVIRKTAPFVNVPEGLADGSGVYSDTWGLCIGVRP
jgi:TonB family protein